MSNKNKNNQLNKLGISLGLGIILTAIAGFNLSAVAQSTYENDPYPSNERDSNYGDLPDELNPLDLMHRAQQLNRRTSVEFNEEYQGQLDNSVSDFKQLQQQRILEQQQQPQVVPVESLENFNN